MMSMKNQKKMNKNYSHIKDIKTLREEIALTKAEIKEKEKEFGQRWKRLPAESFKYIGYAITNNLLNKSIIFKGFDLAKETVQKVFSKKTGDDKDDAIKGFSMAQKIGLYTAIGYLLKKFRKHKNE